MGLSPRVRGSRDRGRERFGESGSIPACAGEPLTCSTVRWAIRVYPRVCGGAEALALQDYQVEGLSPRVRGSRVERLPRGRVFGSIPACAGEPARNKARDPVVRVYPRVCGGATAQFLSSASRVGLSPRVRGSHRQRAVMLHREGSIPACAGEPSGAGSRRRHRRVYPRVCGGAAFTSLGSVDIAGLSPRVRGSRRGRGGSLDQFGSIPACAGEPPGSQR